MKTVYATVDLFSTQPDVLCYVLLVGESSYRTVVKEADPDNLIKKVGDLVVVVIDDKTNFVRHVRPIEGVIRKAMVVGKPIKGLCPRIHFPDDLDSWVWDLRENIQGHNLITPDTATVSALFKQGEGIRCVFNPSDDDTFVAQ